VQNQDLLLDSDADCRLPTSALFCPPFTFKGAYIHPFAHFVLSKCTSINATRVKLTRGTGALGKIEPWDIHLRGWK
jgi:hypothetical protein